MLYGLALMLAVGDLLLPRIIRKAASLLDTLRTAFRRGREKEVEMLGSDLG